VARQCKLLSVSRSSCYYKPKPVDEGNEFLLRKIDEIYTEQPYYGSPRITAELKRQGIMVNHKTIERLMRLMGIAGIHPRKKPKTSPSDNVCRVYPYLLDGLDINHPNQVWGTDITYIRGKGVWFYLVAILDWFSRYVITWSLSPTLCPDFCAAAVTKALAVAVPETHNSDQGSQFTSEIYLGVLKRHPEIKISMDGRGRCFDNIMTERLWRTVKYEEVYLKEYRSYEEASNSLEAYLWKYNHKRLHQSLGYRTPAEVYFGKQNNNHTHSTNNKQ
jgi:putative transposase